MRFTSESPSATQLSLPPFSPSPVGSTSKLVDPSSSIRRVLFEAHPSPPTAGRSSPASSSRGGTNSLGKRRGFYGGDSDESEDDDDESEGDGSDDDEEGNVASTSRNPSKPPNALSASIGPTDPLEKYEAQHRSLAWQRSHQTSSLHSSRIHSLLSASTGSSSSRPVASSSRLDREEREMAEVRRMLEGMRVEREEEERRDRADFEARNKALWEGIESTISTSEQAHLLAVRQKQEEAEQKAAAMRAAAEKKKKHEDEERERLATAEKDKAAKAEAQKVEAARLEQEEKEKGAAGAGLGGLESKGAEYGLWVDKMKNIKDNILPKVNSSPDWKKKCNAVKRQITPKIGQITNSQPVILRITSEISLILHSAQAASPEIYIWVLNHLSKILIKQAETEVAAKPAACFPLARLVVGLMLMGHAEGLGECLMARLVKKCPWVVPFYPARKPDQTEEHYRKSLGHFPLNSPNPETPFAHSSRQTGILTLYLAILSLPTTPLPPPPPSHPPYPAPSPTLLPPHFTLPAAWSWLAAILRPGLVDKEVVPGMVGAMLDVCGEVGEGVYGKQWGKMLRVLGREVEMAGAGADGKGGGEGAKGGRERLRLGLERWGKEGRWGVMEGSVMDAE